MFGRRAVEQGLRVAADDHQQVVEVVGNPAGQPSDSVHFLGLAKLLFQFPPVRNIRGNPSHPVEFSILIEDGERTVVNPSHRAVRTDNSIDFLAGLLRVFLQE